MKAPVVAALAALLLVAAGLAWGAAQRAGPAWDDTAPSGHSALAEHLGRQARVAVLQSSLALLPADTGAGTTLFLFATGREPSAAEGDAVRGLAERGGTVVVAADGGHANLWLESLGGAVHGFPPSLPPNSTARDCLPARFDAGGRSQAACLPSPTVLADQAGQTQDGRDVLGTLTVAVGLDLDGDGNLGLGDQPPVAYPVGYAWTLGAGRVALVADGEAWTNAALQEAPDNLALASLLAGNPRTIYLDSTGRATGPAAVAAGIGAAASDPRSLAGGALLLCLASLAGALALQRRHRAWRPHEQDLASTPPHLLAEATAHLRASLGEPTHSRPHPALEPTP